MRMESVGDWFLVEAPRFRTIALDTGLAERVRDLVEIRFQLPGGLRAHHEYWMRNNLDI